MKGLRYIDGVSTLKLDQGICAGCGMCMNVCPHGVFTMKDRKASIVDIDACMECGACAKNCPANAIRVSPGVGCASYVIQTWFKKDKSACACGKGGCC